MATAVLPKGESRGRRFDDLFFSAMALLILTTVFVGFARTYFLAGIFRAPLPSLIVHIHGAVFSSWILFLIAQISLVSAGRVDLHRRLGLAGFGLASLMVILGVLAATNSMARGFTPPGFPFGALTFYAIPIIEMVGFATLIYFAYRARFYPAAHKRLILIATILLLFPAIDRIRAMDAAKPFFTSIFVYIFLLILITYDFWSLGKVHRATIWASAFVVIVTQAGVPIGNTAVWHEFAGWVRTLSRS